MLGNVVRQLVGFLTTDQNSGQTAVTICVLTNRACRSDSGEVGVSQLAVRPKDTSHKCYRVAQERSRQTANLRILYVEAPSHLPIIIFYRSCHVPANFLGPPLHVPVDLNHESVSEVFHIFEFGLSRGASW